MEIEKMLLIFQNSYATSIAENINTYDKLKVLEIIIEKRKDRQVLLAPYLNQHLKSLI